MSLRIDEEAPDVTAETTQGTLRLHEWIGNGWALLFSRAKDFNPVCATELGYLAGLRPEFDKRHCKLLGLSVDRVEDHERWAEDIEELSGQAPNYPLIGDPELSVAKRYDMLPAAGGASAQGRAAGEQATVRSLFIIGPDKRIKLMLTYPMSTGRNFEEVLRVLDSLQLSARHPLATPVNWKQGEEVIIVPAVSNDEAKARFPEGWKTLKPYLRLVPQPQSESSLAGSESV